MEVYYGGYYPEQIFNVKLSDKKYKSEFIKHRDTLGEKINMLNELYLKYCPTDPDKDKPTLKIKIDRTIGESIIKYGNDTKDLYDNTEYFKNIKNLINDFAKVFKEDVKIPVIKTIYDICLVTTSILINVQGLNHVTSFKMFEDIDASLKKNFDDTLSKQTLKKINICVGEYKKNKEKIQEYKNTLDDTTGKKKGSESLQSQEERLLKLIKSNGIESVVRADLNKVRNEITEIREDILYNFIAAIYNYYQSLYLYTEYIYIKLR